MARRRALSWATTSVPSMLPILTGSYSRAYLVGRVTRWRVPGALTAAPTTHHLPRGGGGGPHFRIARLRAQWVALAAQWATKTLSWVRAVPRFTLEPPRGLTMLSAAAIATSVRALRLRAASGLGRCARRAAGPARLCSTTGGDDLLSSTPPTSPRLEEWRKYTEVGVALYRQGNLERAEACLNRAIDVLNAASLHTAEALRARAQTLLCIVRRLHQGSDRRPPHAGSLGAGKLQAGAGPLAARRQPVEGGSGRSACLCQPVDRDRPPLPAPGAASGASTPAPLLVTLRPRPRSTRRWRRRLSKTLASAILSAGCWAARGDGAGSCAVLPSSQPDRRLQTAVRLPGAWAAPHQHRRPRCGGRRCGPQLLGPRRHPRRRPDAAKRAPPLPCSPLPCVCAPHGVRGGGANAGRGRVRAAAAAERVHRRPGARHDTQRPRGGGHQA